VMVGGLNIKKHRD